MKLISTAAPAGRLRLLRVRIVRSALALAGGVGVWLMLACSPAAAKLAHNYEGSFNGGETPTGSLGEFVVAMAVDNSSGPSAGDVYVGGATENAPSHVYKFAANGKYAGVQLNGSETPQKSFGLVYKTTHEGSHGIAVDGSTGANKGDVYVFDVEHMVVDRFGEDGEFKCEISGKEYGSLSAEEQKAECAGPAGSKTQQGGFTTRFLGAPGIAVDPLNGDVYVSDPGSDVIDEFNEKGEYISQIAEPAHITMPSALAFNSSGDLYVVNGSWLFGGKVVELVNGVFTAETDSKAATSVTVNTKDDLVYVYESGEKQTAEYDSAGNLISTFGKEQGAALGFVGVNAASGRIYASNLFGGPVYMYGPLIISPEVETGGADGVTEKDATLRGEVEPDPATGEPVESCEFEFASKYTLDHIQKVSASEGASFRLKFERQQTGWKGVGRFASNSTVITEVLSSADTPVPGEEISGPGIKPGTTIAYYGRAEKVIVLSQETEVIPAKSQKERQEKELERQVLHAELPKDAGAKTVQQALEALPALGMGNVAVSGPARGPWTVEFTGSLANSTVPLLRVETNSSAFVKMTIEPDWAAASKAACAPATPYSGKQQVSAALTSLAPSMPYGYRLVASDAGGTGDGEYASFTTFGLASVDRIAAEAKQTSVRFWAKIDPFGSETKCHIQYVDNSSFEASQWANAATIACGPEVFKPAFDSTVFPYVQDAVATGGASGLARGTGYRYRFVVENKSGRSEREGSFETWGIQKFAVEMFGSSHETDRLAGASSMIWEPGLLENALQAGAHPYELVTTIDFSPTQAIHRCEEAASCPEGHIGEEIVEGKETLQNVKDIKVGLPPGLIGNPSNFPKCDAHEAREGECPTDSQVGVLEYWTDYPMKQPDGFAAPAVEERAAEGCESHSYCLVPLYNLEPQHANPAEFGNPGDVTRAQLPFEVRAGADYGITDDSVDIHAEAPVQRLRVRIWGVPGNAGHEAGRHLGCPLANTECKPEQTEAPLLRNPTSCAGPQTVSAEFDTWSEPGVFISKSSELPPVQGCYKLAFEPSFEARATTSLADSPSGMNVTLKVPQNEEPDKLGSADLKDATVTFPAGMVVNPSSAHGLEGCSEGQVGFTGFSELDPRFEPGVRTAQFTPGPAQCPDASKLGRVKIHTRLLEHPIEGAMYLATPHSNPFDSLIAVYLTAYDPATGVVIKLPGEVNLDPATGQLTTTFDQNPQLPFEELQVKLFGGEETTATRSQAAFTTPFTCGSYAVGTDLTPWSAPEGKDATPSSRPFTVAGAPGGGTCVHSEAQAPNNPGFAAGTASPVAGSFSPFVLKLAREDGSQHFGGVNVTLPPGLIGKIAGLQQCPQAAIEAAQARSHELEGSLETQHPSCPAGSEVGVVHVGVGSGAPYYVTGHAYFAGPYKGAPFSLVFVTPAVAGPFDLGTVVVRAALYIDPNTAQVTVKSDQFPTILYGVPLDVRSIGVDMNRNEFVLNPTSCNPMSVTGQESSTAGQAAVLTERFQVGGCTTLPFHPSLTATSNGVTSRHNGASLIVHVTSGMGQANIAKVKVTLPKQLPTRQETLPLACLEAVFVTNPASCPAGSAIGTAVAHTPVLSSPLTGPVYIVSHGGAAFPDVEAVLQGEGVTIVLDGKTDIKNGITTSTFGSIPDAPVSSFEMKLPEGPHSILAAPAGLCSTQTVLVKRTVKSRRNGHVRRHLRVVRRVHKRIADKLTMSTFIQGQNGAVINQKTPLKIGGCSGVAAKHKAKKHKKHAKHKGHGKHGKKG